MLIKNKYLFSKLPSQKKLLSYHLCSLRTLNYFHETKRLFSLKGFFPQTKVGVCKTELKKVTIII